MKDILYFIISALLLCLSWPPSGLPFISFVAFVPLLYRIELYIYHNNYTKNIIKILFLCVLFAFIWNFICVIWLYNSKELNDLGYYVNSMRSLFIPVILNSIILVIPIYIYIYFRIYFIRNIYGIFLFLIIFVGYEKFHMSWELSWPWFILGNIFSKFNMFIQWYEYTGVLGGSIWILLINCLIVYRLFKYNLSLNIIFNKILIVLLLVPLLLSLFIYYNYKEINNPLKVAVIQPNIDPYEEKYYISPITIYNYIKNISQLYTSKGIDYIVTPETSLTGYYNINLSNIKEDYFIHDIYKWLNNKTTLIYGASIINQKKFYNSSLFISRKNKIFIHNKYKLVPGVEFIPYYNIISIFLSEKIKNDYNDRNYLYNRLINNYNKIYENNLNNSKIASFICYESIFPTYISKYIKSGANLIVYLTNDSWWGDTNGHKQLFMYGNLRAIENRRSIIRAANSGISGFIDQRGDVIKAIPYGIKGYTYCVVNINSKLTFYSKYGDIIGNFCLIFFIFISLLCIVKRIKNNIFY